MKKNNFKNIYFLLIIIICSCSTAIKKPWDTINGSHYRCPGYTSDSTCITLSMIKKECKVEFVPGESIPPEATEKVILKYKDIVKEIRGPDDFAELGCECIDIWNEKQALEYLRFFSSYYIVHLFDEQVLEIYPENEYEKCIGVCISKRLWKKLGLHKPIIEELPEGFNIERFIIKPIPEPWFPSIYYQKVFVSRLGKIKLLKEEYIPVCPERTKNLFFPMYM